MTDHKNLSQAPATCQDAFLLLEEQQLDAITGGGGNSFPGREPLIYERVVKPDADRNHPNNGTYIPPSDPEALKMLGIHPSSLPENMSFTFHENGIDFVRHKRPSF